MTIDLTQIQFAEPPKWVKRLQSILGKPTWFRVRCPHCKERGAYGYDEVRPISDLSKGLEELNKKDDVHSPQFKEWKNGGN